MNAAQRASHVRFSVIGTGHLGTTFAASMASLGCEVLCVDTDARKIKQLAAGQPPIFEPGLAGLVRRGLEAGRLRFCTSYPDAAAFADIHFICTGTPLQAASDRADLSQVRGAVQALMPWLDRARPGLIVGRSTVPVGTARRLAEKLTDASVNAEIAWNPEFLREGTAVTDSLNPDRIVVGVTSRWAEDLMRQVYDPLLRDGAPFVVTTLETAELAKVAANAFLATKVSFINAMAEMCETVDADVNTLAKIIGGDPRIGSSFLRAGIGFGGGCLSKDLRAFMAAASDLGTLDVVKFLREVHEINIRQRCRVAEMAAEMVGGDMRGMSVAVLGAAFKPGSDDVRDSPALDVSRMLHGLGAKVRVFDPAAITNARRIAPELSYTDSAIEALHDADIVLLLTEWPEFVDLDPGSLTGVVAQKKIIDGRNVLDPAIWRGSGWQYRALGTGAEPPSGPGHQRPPEALPMSPALGLGLPTVGGDPREGWTE